MVGWPTALGFISKGITPANNLSIDLKDYLRNPYYSSDVGRLADWLHSSVLLVGRCQPSLAQKFVLGLCRPKFLGMKKPLTLSG
jgi:hypothetical protein